jgi:hypothetical protein
LSLACHVVWDSGLKKKCQAGELIFSSQNDVTFCADRHLMTGALCAATRRRTKGGPVQISCFEVIRELSSYIDDDMKAELRAEIAQHLPTCAHCTAVYDGLRNTITLMGDGRVFELPSGFSQRLRQRLPQKPL